MSSTTPAEPRSAGPPRPAWRLLAPLGVMMFLQYGLRGVWLPYLPNYLGSSTNAGGLGFSTGQIGWIMGLAAAIGAVTAPLLAGQVADRYMNAERALALLALVCGAASWWLGHVQSFAAFLGLSLILSVAFNPTQALTNGLCFHNLPRPEKQYPPVRMWGTIGWVTASSLFPILWLNTASAATNTARIADALKLAGLVAVPYAAFCLWFLPRTPPQVRHDRPVALLGALHLLRHRGFLAVVSVGLLVSLMGQVYIFRMSPFLKNDVGLADRWIGGAMALGQTSEIFVIGSLGLLLSRLGYRRVMLIGVGAYIVRYGVYASTSNPAAVLTAQLLHGPCFACFFAAAYLYVDRIAPRDVRYSAQTMFNLVTLGLGPILAGFVNECFSAAGAPVWWGLVGIAAAAFALLAWLFPRSAVQRCDEPSA